MRRSRGEGNTLRDFDAAFLSLPLKGKVPPKGADEGQVPDQVVVRRGDFAACGRRVTFPAMGKSPKDRRGTAQNERFALIFALPPDPLFTGAAN